MSFPELGRVFSVFLVFVCNSISCVRPSLRRQLGDLIAGNLVGIGPFSRLLTFSVSSKSDFTLSPEIAGILP